jgi:hypothetical protein
MTVDKISMPSNLKEKITYYIYIYVCTYVYWTGKAYLSTEAHSKTVRVHGTAM